MPRGKVWTKQEDDILRKHCHKPWHYVRARLPHRSKKALKDRYYALWLHKDGNAGERRAYEKSMKAIKRSNSWTKKEDETLVSMRYSPFESIAKQFPCRTPNAVRKRMSHLKLLSRKQYRGRAPYEPWEDDLIKLCYQQQNFPRLEKLLPYRSKSALMNRAVKLGVRQKSLSKEKRVAWPGMDGGRFAYGLTKAEWEAPPQDIYGNRI